MALPAPFVPPVTSTRLPLNSPGAFAPVFDVGIIVSFQMLNQHSQAAGRGTIGLLLGDFVTGFLTRITFAFCFLTLPFRVIVHFDTGEMIRPTYLYYRTDRF